METPTTPMSKHERKFTAFMIIMLAVIIYMFFSFIITMGRLEEEWNRMPVKNEVYVWNKDTVTITSVDRKKKTFVYTHNNKMYSDRTDSLKSFRPLYRLVLPDSTLKKDW